MQAVRGVEVGNIFKLGTKFSEALGATFLDENGESKPAYMGSYGIGPARLMACVVELNHDDKGIIWPASIAPYQVSLVSLVNQKQQEQLAQVEAIYTELRRSGLEVLFDDRDERAGVKFNDAELLGIPIRVTLGRKGLEKSMAEVSIRKTGEQREIALASLAAELGQFLSQL
jgi:prolyl-tRNA synthetase